MEATEQYFHVVLFIMVYKVVLTFKSVDETRVMQLRGATIQMSYLAVMFLCWLLFRSAKNEDLSIIKQRKYVEKVHKQLQNELKAIWHYSISRHTIPLKTCNKIK